MRVAIKRCDTLLKVQMYECVGWRACDPVDRAWYLEQKLWDLTLIIGSCAEVPSKLLILHCLWPPNGDGYLMEKCRIVVTGSSCRNYAEFSLIQDKLGCVTCSQCKLVNWRRCQKMLCISVHAIRLWHELNNIGSHFAKTAFLTNFWTKPLRMCLGLCFDGAIR